MLKAGELSRGDLVISTITFVSKKYNKTVVQEGNSYKVDEIFPIDNPEGFVIISDIGRWYINFSVPNDGDSKFEKVISRTEHDELSDLGIVPVDILDLIMNKPGIKRNKIVEYLSNKLVSSSSQNINNFENQVLKVLYLLDVHQYISLANNTLNEYKITAKGVNFLKVNNTKTDKSIINSNQNSRNIPANILKDHTKFSYEKLLFYISLFLSLILILDWAYNNFNFENTPSINIVRRIFGVVGFCLGFCINPMLFSKWESDFLSEFGSFCIMMGLGLLTGIMGGFIAAFIGPFAIMIEYKIIRNMINKRL
jgi:hypothetical protein